MEIQGPQCQITAKTWNMDVIEYLKLLLSQLSWHNKDDNEDEDSKDDECAQCTKNTHLNVT